MARPRRFEYTRRSLIAAAAALAGVSGKVNEREQAEAKTFPADVALLMEACLKAGD
jgi:hypothetical protein